MSTPLDAEALRSRLVGTHYAKLDVVASTGSTNADLRREPQDRAVLVAGEQTAGQGRRGRSWTSPGGGLYLSALFRPANVPAGRLPWLTLIAGVALVRTAASVGVQATLKWPNDLLVHDRKAAGVLAEITAEHAVVVGIGLNVATLPAGVEPGAGGLEPTSLADHTDRDLDHTAVAATLLTELAVLERDWRDAGGDPHASGLYDEYVRECSTLGRRVRVELTGSELSGTAQHLEVDGTLVVRDEAGVDHSVSAGDVVHLRVR